jgi:CubicO group peptidase (beta-lactamase class C family)
MTPTGFTDVDAPWPTDAWSCSTPEEQGVDSTRLLEMLRTVKNKNIGIDGLLVIRNGRLIMEMYRYPYQAESLHHVYSCTKSFISALIGIAIEQGGMKGSSQRLTDFFSDRQIANLDEAKRTITLGNLLTMSGGYTWLGGMLEQPTLQEWWQSLDASWDQRPVLADRSAGNQHRRLGAMVETAGYGEARISLYERR